MQTSILILLPLHYFKQKPYLSSSSSSTRYIFTEHFMHLFAYESIQRRHPSEQSIHWLRFDKQKPYSQMIFLLKKFKTKQLTPISTATIVNTIIVFPILPIFLKDVFDFFILILVALSKKSLASVKLEVTVVTETEILFKTGSSLAWAPSKVALPSIK